MLQKEDDKNIELTRRINADLRAKMAATSKAEDYETPDFTEDSAYVKDLEQTHKYAWVWGIVVIIAVIILIVVGINHG